MLKIYKLSADVDVVPCWESVFLSHLNLLNIPRLPNPGTIKKRDDRGVYLILISRLFTLMIPNYWLEKALIMIEVMTTRSLEAVLDSSSQKVD